MMNKILALEAFCVTDKKHLIKNVNPSALTLFQYELNEVTERPFYDFLSPEYKERYLSLEENAYLEAELITKNQKKIWINIKLHKEENEIIVLIQDITRYKGKEFAYVRQTKELVGFHEALNNYVCIERTTPRGVITYLNDLTCKILKYDRDELIGKNHRLINSGYHSESFFADMYKVLEAKQIWKGLIRNKCKDGSYIWLDTCISPIFSGETLVEYLVVRFDVTSRIRDLLAKDFVTTLRQKYFESLTNKESFYKRVIFDLLKMAETNAAAFVVIESELAIDTSTNEFFAAYVPNIREGEVKDLSATSIYYPHIIKTFEKILTSKKDFHLEETTKEDGTGFYEVISFPIFQSDKLIAGVAFLNENKKISPGFPGFLAPVIHALSEVIYSIKMEEKLANISKISEHSEKLISIGQMTAGIGHEVNNSLAVVRGHLTILENSIAQNNINPQEILESINRINIAEERIENIVKGLGVFSRIDVDKPALFLVEKLIYDTFIMLKDIYLKNGVELTYKPANSKTYILGSRGRVQQVLINLITNAKDATEGRELRKVNIFARAINENFEIAVTDNGRGIPEKIINKIFEPFFTTKEVNKGTGIGLYLVRNIINDHNGKVSINSIVGAGTTFTVSFPAQKHEETQEESKVNPDTLQQTFAKPLNILIVDDEEDLVNILSHLIKGMGAKVETAFNGKQGYQKFVEGNFDIIISDISMPEMNGTELIKKVKAHQDKKPSFVFITGNVIDDGTDKEAFNMADASLTKPFRKNIIFDTLNKLIK